MTDRELLELAAKAAGLVIDKSQTNGGGMHNTGFDSSGNAILDWHNGIKWNPLTDDGDALRLAIKLGLTINPYQEGVFVSRFEGEEVVGEPFEEIGRPDADATRRAIVRAAAAIGKEMK